MGIAALLLTSVASAGPEAFDSPRERRATADPIFLPERLVEQLTPRERRIHEARMQLRLDERELRSIWDARGRGVSWSDHWIKREREQKVREDIAKDDAVWSVVLVVAAFICMVIVISALFLNAFRAMLPERDPHRVRRRHRTGILLAFAFVPLSATAAEKPNVLVIMADDLGFSDLGCYGGEIDTPHLDSLAKNGLRFSQFYNTARCWPTRAALLTGYYAQQVRRDQLPGVRSGGRGKRPAWAKLVPELLKPAGYRSYHSGKWHLDGMPIATGFDRSYYLRDQGRFFYPKVHWKDDRKLPPVKPGTDYYATTAIADHAIECLKEHAAKHKQKPFFHYLAFTAPHFPLHALPKDIDKYRKRYRAGWKELRAARWKRIADFGVIHGKLSAVEREVGPPYHFPDHLKILGDVEVNRPVPWEKLTPGQREFQADKMAIHAAMIDRMDQEIGRVLAQLRAMKAFENTLILFLSDNGASAEIMVRTDGHDRTAPRGSGKSYLCLGPGWSTTANTPFRRHKTWVHEGGIATPLIAHWPRGISARNEWRTTPGHVIDFVPTILAAARAKPEPPKERTIPARPGKSLLPVFKRDTDLKRDLLWWLHEGNQALRMGHWKLVKTKSGDWELFDLSRDRTETVNLATKNRQRVEQMSRAWSKQLESFRLLYLPTPSDTAP